MKKLNIEPVEVLRARLQRTINSNPVDVDKRVFHKTQSEKDKLVALKSMWLNKMKKKYPDFKKKQWSKNRGKWPQTKAN